MIETAYYTDIGGRPRNEDSVREVRAAGCICVVVADGLGGHGGGEEASSLAAETICSAWDGCADRAHLMDLVRLAHTRILGIQTPSCAMKSTAAALLLEEGHAVWAHVGDTRLYHFRDGELVYQTTDHSASQIAVLLGEITVDQIRFHEDRSRITRALGQDDVLKVDTGEEMLEPGFHAFLLCTDGFWEYVLEPEMEQDLAQSDTPEQWISRMAERLSGRVPPDNDNNTAAAAWTVVEQK